MAGNVTDWVWKHSRAVNAPFIVLLAIAHEADRDGIAVMSVSELARKARLSDRSVQHAVRDLGALRELEVRSGKGGRGHRAIYRVAVKGEDPAPFTASKGADPAGLRPERVKILHPSKGEDPAPFTPLKSQVNGHNPEDPAPFTISDESSTTAIDEVQVKPESAVDSRPDVERLCEYLADRIAANGSKPPKITKRWRDAARLMLDNDGRTEQKIMAAIDWCQNDEFWRANILSMPKLREKYDQLRLRAMRANSRPRSRQDETDALFDRAMERARARDAQEANSDPRGNGLAHPLRPGLLSAPGD